MCLLHVLVVQCSDDLTVRTHIPPPGRCQPPSIVGNVKHKEMTLQWGEAVIFSLYPFILFCHTERTGCLKMALHLWHKSFFHYRLTFMTLFNKSLNSKCSWKEAEGHLSAFTLVMFGTRSTGEVFRGFIVMELYWSLKFNLPRMHLDQLKALHLLFFVLSIHYITLFTVWVCCVHVFEGTRDKNALVC